MHLTPKDHALAASFAGPEPFEPANETPPLIAFVVQVKRGAEVIQEFEAMGTSSLAVGVQHEGLCNRELGEYLNVKRRAAAAIDYARGKALAHEKRAMELQLQRPDALTVICTGGVRS
jgi:hypothetical protein